YDPHVWMDPVAWGSAVKVVSNRLQQIDPAHATFYQQNSSIYLEKISKLHQAALKTLHSIQPESRVLVTAHDAFNYFGKRYGFEVVGIQGISTDSEAGIKDIGRIVDLLIERKVKAVFVESTVSRRNIEALVEGAQARGHTVTIGGQLFSDAMGKEGTYQGTYLGMIDHNVTTITRALGGKVDPAGLFGKSDGHSDQVEDKE
ncbi:MAG: zinc ABC transporter substrate-binding protein, partial [Bdellovibrionales bacterium]|nr:zinc ABC transporter substrate-binding protein [Bdellovibrionales bacterium]